MAENAPLNEQRRSRRPMGTDRVPVLPPGVSYLIQALHDDSLGFREISAAVEKVPSVAARLLALSNSAWSSPASPVLSLDAACSRLGLQVVRTASIALAVSQPFNPARCPAFDGRTFWSAALLNADAASRLAGSLLPDEVSSVRTAALLSNLGLIWLAEALPVQTSEALKESVDLPSGGLNDHLHAHCGLGFDEAGALLADAWKLPAKLRDAIALQFNHQQHTTPMCRIVSAAAAMVGSLTRKLEWQAADPGLLDLGMSLDDQQMVYASLCEAAGKTAELAETLFNAR